MASTASITDDNRAVLALIQEGDALKLADDFDAALACYNKALAYLSSDYTARVYVLIGHCWRAKRMPAKAIEYYDIALNLEPDFAYAYFARGVAIYEARGFIKDVDDNFRKGFSLVGDDPDMLLTACVIFQKESEFLEAIRLLTKALEIRPDFAQAWITLAHCYQSIGNTVSARSVFERAEKKFPEKTTVTLNLACLMPPIAASNAEIDANRKQFMDNMDRLMQSGFRMQTTDLYSLTLPYFQGYHGRDNTALMQKMAAFFLKTFPETHFTAPHCLVPQKRKEKIRIGFISEALGTDVVTQFYGDLIKGLTHDPCFEVLLFSGSVKVARKIEEVTCTILPPNMREAQQILAKAELDILFFLDIGMGVFTYLLALARLAPVQIVTHGHPITSGIPTMDYYFSYGLVEPPNAQEHYTEKLVLFDKDPVIFKRRPLPEETKTRQELGLPTGDVRLYACPVMLHKIHPDMDAIFAAILERDPKARIVLFDSKYKLLYRAQVQARLKAAMPAHLAERIIFVPHAPGEKFFHILRAVDCNLDTVHYGFGTTAYLLFSDAIPYVTLPGEFMRGRGSYALYKLMDIPDLIAHSPEEYVELAVRLANDAAFKAGISEKIRARCDVMFDDTGIVEEFSRRLKEAYNAGGRGTQS